MAIAGRVPDPSEHAVNADAQSAAPAGQQVTPATVGERPAAAIYECVYCGHACTRVAHIDPERDTHRVMPVRVPVAANGVTARRLMAAIATEEETNGQ